MYLKKTFFKFIYILLSRSNLYSQKKNISLWVHDNLNILTYSLFTNTVSVYNTESQWFMKEWNMEYINDKRNPKTL
jgi:hypothetical protein